MSRSAGPAAAALLLAAAGAAAQPPAFKVVAADVQTVEARVRYTLQATTLPVSRWVAFVPEPPDLPSQAVRGVTATPKSTVVPEAAPPGRKLRMFDLPGAAPAPGGRVPLDFTIKATLRSRTLVPLAAGESPPKVAPLPPAESKFYLAPGPTIDFAAKAFGDWLDAKELRLKKGEPPPAFAERVLDVVRADFNYRFDQSGRPASGVCAQPTTDGAGMTYLFVGALRANKVPARALVGRIAKTRKAGAAPADFEYDYVHLRAEFWLPGVGWVPADPAGANLNPDQPVRAFIGNDGGDQLVFHADVDLRAPYPDQVRTVRLLHAGPTFWAYGRGASDAAPGPSGWDVTTTPAGKD